MENGSNNEKEMRERFNEIAKRVEGKNDKRHESFAARNMDRAISMGRAAWASYFAGQKERGNGGESEEGEVTMPDDRFALLFTEYDPIDDKEGRIGGESEEGESIRAEMSKAEKAMREAIFKSFYGAWNDLKSLENNEKYYKIVLAIGGGRSGATDKLRARIDECERSKEEVAYSSPEGYLAYYGKKLREYAKSAKYEELVQTPYVMKNLERLENNIASGRPTLMHGHLGGGKTELATVAAEEYLVSRAAREEALNYIQEHLTDYSAVFSEGASDDEKQNADAKKKRDFLRVYNAAVAKYSKELREGGGDADRFRPLFVAGSKDLIAADLFVDNTLKVANLADVSAEEYTKEIEKAHKMWLENHAAELSTLSDEERAESEKVALRTISDFYNNKYSGSGTEVQKILGPVYEAARTGRPVIIDEVNAIPPNVLISLNDILTKKPGETCDILGGGTIEIQEGFCIIMTGNISTSNIFYGGTEDFNPAFLSRLDQVQYDYLPMSKDDSFEHQEDPEKNELFHVVLAKLIDRQGNLALPEMEESLRKIFSLCQFAHQTQLVFKGEWRESSMGEFNINEEPRLDKYVVSVRNLINVLNRWDRGAKMSLDEALWEYFIKDITVIEDKNMMIAMAISHGFFNDSDAPHFRLVQGNSIGDSSYYEKEEAEIDYMPRALEYLPMRKVIGVMFGEAPERTYYPEGLSLDDFDVDAEKLSDHQKAEIMEKIDQTKENYSLTKDSLRVLFEQCGCNAA